VHLIFKHKMILICMFLMKTIILTT
jgi:hypothetical protein